MILLIPRVEQACSPSFMDYLIRSFQCNNAARNWNMMIFSVTLILTPHSPYFLQPIHTTTLLGKFQLRRHRPSLRNYLVISMWKQETTNAMHVIIRILQEPIHQIGTHPHNIHLTHPHNIHLTHQQDIKQRDHPLDSLRHRESHLFPA